MLADRLERKYSKNQILQAYLNTIYLGNGAYGVEAAANIYFGEHATQLNLPQAALLAGLIQNPSGYDPILDPADARTRRSQVLARMLHYGDITAAQAAAAERVPLPTSVIRPAVAGDQISDYYVQEVQTELLAQGSPLGKTYDQRYQALFEGGLKIYTNLNPGMQAMAEQTIAADTPANSQGFQQAMVSIDPSHRESAGHGGRRRAQELATTTSSPRAPDSPARGSSCLPCWPPCSRVTPSTTAWWRNRHAPSTSRPIMTC